MATVTSPAPEDTVAQIRRLGLDSDRLEAEARKLRAEAEKLNAEQYKLAAEQLKFERERKLSPWLLLAQGLIAGAALLGAGIALAKFLLTN